MARFNFILPLLLALSSIAAAVPDYFLQLDGLPLVDVSTSTAVTKAVEIQDFTLGIQNAANLGSTGIGAGKVSFGDVSFTRNIDGNSPLIFTALAGGTHINTATVTVTQPNTTGGAPFIQAVYTFSTVLFTSQTLNASAGNPTTEEVSFTYGKLSITYNQRAADGSIGHVSTGSWNRITNTPTRRELPFAA